VRSTGSKCLKCLEEVRHALHGEHSPGRHDSREGAEAGRLATQRRPRPVTGEKGRAKPNSSNLARGPRLALGQD